MKAIVKPKTKKELIEIIKEAIEKEGWKANLNFIDTSLITDMCFLFSLDYGFEFFNGDISEWDVSNVENMDGMFNHSFFNGDINNWNVSNTKSMIGMFAFSYFDKDISNWDVSNVKSMVGMFAYSNFNKDISNWNISNAKNMKRMFAYSEFNKDLEKWENKLNKECNIDAMFKNSKLEKEGNLPKQVVKLLNKN